MSHKNYNYNFYKVRLPFLLVFDGILDRFDLYSHYREYLNRDTVELVKTAPGPSLGKTFVDVANGLCVSRLQHKHIIYMI